MAWQTPKTDWVTNPENPKPEDFNRIEGNIEFLKNDVEAKKDLIATALSDMNQPAQITETYLELATKIRNISKDATAAVGDVEKSKTFYAGGSKKTGTLELTGNAAVGDVEKGKTFYNTNLKTKQTGTLELTGNAVAGDVEKNKTFYNTNLKTKQTGTLELTGNAAVGDVLSGKTFYNTDLKTKRTGTMPNHRGIVLVPGFTNVVIPAGYHDGTGYVKALDVDFEGPGNWASNQGWESVYAWGSAFGGASFSTGWVSIPYDSSVMSKCLEVEVKFSGRVRVTWHIDNGWDGAMTVYSQLYINDVAVGSRRTTSAGSEDNYTEIVTVNSGDRLAIYGRSTTSSTLGSVRGFAITTYRNRVFAELKQGRY